MVDLSIVIVSFNTRDLLARCLDALLAACHSLRTQVIVVDNGSSDGTVEMLRASYPGVQVISNLHNPGFAVANNQGMDCALAESILLLNSDAFVTAATIHQGLETLASIPAAGIVGVRLDNEDGTFQAGDGSFPTLWDDIRYSIGLDQIVRLRKRRACQSAGPVDWVQGACMFVRASAVRDVGGLDSHFFMYSEEVDWCWRFWKWGWEVWYLPETSVVHVGGASSRTNDVGRRTALYRSRLSLRRRLGGRRSTAALWIVMVIGLTGRIVARSIVRFVTRRTIGRQSPASDLELLRAILHLDPLARDAVA